MRDTEGTRLSSEEEGLETGPQGLWTSPVGQEVTLLDSQADGSHPHVPWPVASGQWP